ncbi:MAG: hypothetical protein HC817_05625 [Saprospiraceae bacterium]|nr:hypothetical protein [Saprospiraceae bacterium]
MRHWVLMRKQRKTFFEGKGFQIGVKGKSEGKTNDLWKYRTLNPEKPTSVLSREILYKNTFLIAFTNENATLIAQLKRRF